jgi:hypothetical protein
MSDRVSYEFCDGWGSPLFIFYTVFITLVCLLALELSICMCVYCIRRSARRKYLRLSMVNLDSNEHLTQTTPMVANTT